MTTSDGRTTSAAIESALQRALDLGECGVQVAATLHGEPIVDTWAGSRDEAGTAVGGNTLFPVFSVTKVVTATAAHLQVQRGLLSYDEPVCAKWPEYAAHGKSDISLGHVLSHRSGAPCVDTDATLDQLCDWDWMTSMLADQVPVAKPDVSNAYSPYAFGWIVGELVRRSDPLRRSFAQFVRDEVLLPLKMVDFHLGVPREEMYRVATLLGAEPPIPVPGSLVECASVRSLPLGPSGFNTTKVRRAVLPSFGGVSSARSVVRLFEPYARSGRVGKAAWLTTDVIDRCRRPRPGSVDETYGVVMPVGLGALWHVAPGVSANGPITSVLSHTAAGGTIAWAEPETGLAVSICHNRMFQGPQPNASFAALGDAIRASVQDR
ncbi:MAG: serine hydrolase domain-containing protein [Rhodococcus fascians]